MSTSPYPIFDLVRRAGLFTVLWWIISGGAADSWLIGLPVVLIAAHLSMALKAKQTRRVHLISLFKFIPFFLYESVRGGIDVAQRVYSHRLPLHPALLNYPLRLPEGAPQVFFANSISLLPGTLCTEIRDHTLQIHVLDKTAQVISDLELLELKVAAIFDLDIE